MDRSLLQRDLAEAIGANEWTIHNWEMNTHEPKIRFYPKIMEWLGYCPIVGATSLGARLKRHRYHLGLSASDLALRVKVDTSTLLAWEADEKNPYMKKRFKTVLKIIFSLSEPEL